MILRDAVHETADGRRFLVIHGDEFDGVVNYANWLAYLGDAAYNLALALNHWFNVARRRLGFPYWSLSAYLKRKVKNAVEYIDNFEEAVAEEARRRGVDGVVCGHIHHAEIRDLDGILYCNDGDWVESCTALVEHRAGRLSILRLGRGKEESQRYPQPGAGLVTAAVRCKILIATDAWYPQVNGVVRTLSTVGAELAAMGHEVLYVTPDRFRTLPCPTYPEIRLAILPTGALARLMKRHRPDAIHIATEGPIGLAARRYCRRHGLAFTTSLHTRFPEYVNARVRLPVSWGYAALRWFHGAAARVMVATETLREELTARASPTSACGRRGVDIALFHPARQGFPAPAPPDLHLRRPGRGREEHRGLPGAGAAAAPRWWSATGRSSTAAAALPRRGVRRQQAGRGAGATLRRGRRVRIPEPHRHLRQRDPGGARLGRAGRRLPGAGAARRDRRPRRWAASTTTLRRR